MKEVNKLNVGIVNNWSKEINLKHIIVLRKLSSKLILWLILLQGSIKINFIRPWRVLVKKIEFRIKKI